MTAPHAAAMLDVALDEAQRGALEGGVPIGAALFRSDGTLLGRGRNRQVQDGDPSVHAEAEAIRDAGPQASYRDTILATTLAPCEACSDLIRRAGIGSVVMGDAETFHGDPNAFRSSGIEVTDLRSRVCVELLGRVIREHPELWAG